MQVTIHVSRPSKSTDEWRRPTPMPVVYENFVTCAARLSADSWRGPSHRAQSARSSTIASHHWLVSEIEL